MTSLTLLLALSACPDGEPQCALLAREASQVTVDRATLQRLLEEPEFTRARNRNGNIFAVLWEQFFAWLKRVFQTEGAATFARAVPFAVLTLAFAIALLAVLRFARVRRRRDERPTAAGAEPLALKPAPEHLAAARRLLATSPREAIREALLGLLSSLERRKLARPDRVKTNRELCAELPGRGAAPELTREVTERVTWYDGVFYSLAEVPPDDARAFVDDVARLVS